MVECPMPQDVFNRETKFLANLSIKKIMCIVIALAIIALMLFGVCKEWEWGFLKVAVCALPALPFLAFGFIKIGNQGLEKIGPTLLWENVICKPTRKKEVHFDEMEKYKKNHYWNISAPEDKKGKKKITKIAPSKNYPAIK